VGWQNASLVSTEFLVWLHVPYRIPVSPVDPLRFRFACSISCLIHSARSAGQKADCTLDVKARDKSGLSHFVNVLGSDSQHFCNLSNFQGFFAVFEYFDQSHCRLTFE
jgi:hypothetical protein